MRIRSTFHIWVLFMAMLVFSMPLVSLAQQNSVPAEATAAGEADAEATVNKTLWFAAGLLMPVVGVIGGYVLGPSPPSSKLLGKSPEYVAFYTDAYQAKAKNLQGRSALIGFGVGVGVTGATYGCCLVSSYSLALPFY